MICATKFAAFVYISFMKLPSDLNTIWRLGAVRIRPFSCPNCLYNYHSQGRSRRAGSARRHLCYEAKRNG